MITVDRREHAPEAAAWPGAIAAITLFKEDLEVEPSSSTRPCSSFPSFYEDDNSAVFKFGDTLVNLLRTSEGPRILIAPAPVAAAAAGARFQFTLAVDDVDATCERLRERGAELLNGPMDRPWGIRTASFRDPGGHIWEYRAVADRWNSPPASLPCRSAMPRGGCPSSWPPSWSSSDPAYACSGSDVSFSWLAP